MPVLHCLAQVVRKSFDHRSNRFAAPKNLRRFRSYLRSSRFEHLNEGRVEIVLERRRILRVLKQIAHQPGEVLIQLFQRERAHVSGEDLVVREAYDWRAKFSAHKPCRVLKAMTIVWAGAAERGDKTDPQ